MIERQPDSLPTNKAITASAVTAAAQLAVTEVWPQIVPVFLAGPAMTGFVSVAVPMLLGLSAAWFVPDRLGIPVHR